jgi:hypothetical protein
MSTHTILDRSITTSIRASAWAGALRLPQSLARSGGDLVRIEGGQETSAAHG